MEKTPFLPRSNRISSVDALRGVAVLGLVGLSVHGFSMVSAATNNPTVNGALEGVSKTIWMVGHMVADQKFISILSIIFGVSILLFAENIGEKGFTPFKIFYRRMICLFIFGLFHAYIVWHGDYLVALAICGALAFLFRGLSPWILLVFGMIIYFVPSFNYWLFGKTMEFWPPEAIEQLDRIWQPNQQSLQCETNALRGGILDQLTWRTPEAFKGQTSMFMMIDGWRILAMMMIGMALYKTGLWNGKWSTKTSLLVSVAAIISGWWLSFTGVKNNFAANWEASYSMFFGWQWNYFGSLFSAVGYVVLIELVSRQMSLGLLAEVGRLACTNILLTSVICSFIFYGHGLALFGQLNRIEQTFMIPCLWVILFLFSHYWLKRFNFGPIEQLLRLLTYGKNPQFKK